MTLRNAIIFHLLTLAFVVGGIENTWGETLLFHASASGRQTMDEGEGGGNPFASALIEILQKDEVRLGDFPERLRELTSRKAPAFKLRMCPKMSLPDTGRLCLPGQGRSESPLCLSFQTTNARAPIHCQAPPTTVIELLLR
jgi:hypothetical protein